MKPHFVPIPYDEEYAETFAVRSLKRNLLLSKTLVSNICKSEQFQSLLLEGEVDADEFFYKHSLGPCVAMLRRSSWKSFRFDPNYHRYGGIRVCHHCLLQDISEEREPYFRRFHQLLHLNWCVEHDKPLTEIEGDDAVYVTAMTVLEKGTPAEVGQLCVGLRDWGRVCRILLNLRTPLHPNVLKQLDANRLKELQLGDRRRRGTFFDQASKKFSAQSYSLLRDLFEEEFSRGFSIGCLSWRKLTLYLAAMFDSTTQLTGCLKEHGLVCDLNNSSFQREPLVFDQTRGLRAPSPRNLPNPCRL
jgi:hypothetical protein